MLQVGLLLLLIELEQLLIIVIIALGPFPVKTPPAFLDLQLPPRKVRLELLLDALVKEQRTLQDCMAALRTAGTLSPDSAEIVVAYQGVSQIAEGLSV